MATTRKVTTETGSEQPKAVCKECGGSGPVKFKGHGREVECQACAPK